MIDVLRDPRLYLAAAALQAGDAAICVPPIPFVAQCLDDVGYPQAHRWVFPVIKGASAIGLAAAPRYPGLARLTAALLTLYFMLAVGAHIRVRDLRLNFVSASSLLAFYAALAVSGPPKARFNELPGVTARVVG